MVKRMLAVPTYTPVDRMLKARGDVTIENLRRAVALVGRGKYPPP